MRIGIDCVEIGRFESERFTDISFLKKIYTDDEIDYCLSRKPSSQHFAVRFAAKEAVRKCFRDDFELSLRDIEITNINDYPEVHIEQNIYKTKIEISLSHSDTMAVAVALKK